MSKNALLIIGLLVLAGGVAAFQLTRKPVTEMTEQTTPTTQVSPTPVTSPAVSPTTDAESMMEDGQVKEVGKKDVQVVEIEAGSFYYEPNMIKVKKGQRVQVVIKSVDMMHDFNIDELNVKSEIVKSGETGTVEFVASKVGSFEYYCSVGQHRQNGQVGTIVVEE